MEELPIKPNGSNPALKHSDSSSHRNSASFSMFITQYILSVHTPHHWNLDVQHFLKYH
jgi:hypothetical protein